MCASKGRMTARSRVRHNTEEGKEADEARGVRRMQCREQGPGGQSDLIIPELVMPQELQGTFFLSSPCY